MPVCPRCLHQILTTCQTNRFVVHYDCSCLCIMQRKGVSLSIFQESLLDNIKKLGVALTHVKSNIIESCVNGWIHHDTKPGLSQMSQRRFWTLSLKHFNKWYPWRRTKSEKDITKSQVKMTLVVLSAEIAEIVNYHNVSVYLALWQLGSTLLQMTVPIRTPQIFRVKATVLPHPSPNLCLTWVRMNAIGVDGLRCRLPIGLRWEGTESIDPNRSGYAGHGSGRDAWGCAGACR